jgi:hypothetical protein
LLFSHAWLNNGKANHVPLEEKRHNHFKVILRRHDIPLPCAWVIIAHERLAVQLILQARVSWISLPTNGRLWLMGDACGEIR